MTMTGIKKTKAKKLYLITLASAIIFSLYASPALSFTQTDQVNETTVDLSMLKSGIMVEGSASENTAFYLSYRRSQIHLFLPEGEEDEGYIIFKASIITFFKHNQTYQSVMIKQGYCHEKNITQFSVT